MVEAASASMVGHLVNYGALGVCLALALLAIVFLERARQKVADKLSAEQQARVDDAKAYTELALELQTNEMARLEKLTVIVDTLKQMGVRP